MSPYPNLWQIFVAIEFLYCGHGQGLYYRLAGDVKLGTHNAKCNSFSREYNICTYFKTKLLLKKNLSSPNNRSKLF